MASGGTALSYDDYLKANPGTKLSRAEYDAAVASGTYAYTGSELERDETQANIDNTKASTNATNTSTNLAIKDSEDSDKEKTQKDVITMWQNGKEPSADQLKALGWCDEDGNLNDLGEAYKAEATRALESFSNDVFADLSLSEDIEGMTWDDYKTKCENEGVEIPYGFDETDFEMMKQGIISERAENSENEEGDEGDAVTDWRVGYEPTMNREETVGQIESGNFSPNILKNYEYYYGESYIKKVFDETDWELAKTVPSDAKAQLHGMYKQAINAWCSYDEEGCWNYIDSLPNDHPLKEYLDYLDAQGG